MPITHLPLDHLLSSTSPEDFPARRQLSNISTAIAKARKIVVVSGAGISCSSGIPDFRSADGLYSLVKARYPDSFFSGKELFSSGLFNNPNTTSIFYTFIAELSLECAKAQPTRTHHFIKKLEQKNKLLRSYTQNIDGLERRLGLESGGRGNGFKKKETRNVELHGDLGRVRCVLCFKDFASTPEYVNLFREGEAPECPACEERCLSRISRSARATSVGTLRPSIVLYDEPHPLGDDIGSLTTYDLSRQPDILLIMGTSLKVHGLKRLVKEFAKSVHAQNAESSSTGRNKKKGIVVFVNATPPPVKEWEGIIDYHVQGETDKWVERVEEEWRKVKPQDWEKQTLLDGELPVTAKPRPIKGKSKSKAKPNPSTKPKEPIQLPTPRPTASPRSPAKFQSASQAEGYSSPIPVSKTHSADMGEGVGANYGSDSELSDAPPTPPSPWSPSKRRSNAFDSPSKKTKSFDKDIPITGINATPGKGNLFSFAAKSIPTPTGKENRNEDENENENDWVDEWAVFDSTLVKPLSHSKDDGINGTAATRARSKALGERIENISIPEKKATKSRSTTVNSKPIMVRSPRAQRHRRPTAKVLAALEGQT
ncbi:uncharacterized protein I303_104629 [Kwoniella dejecticola CBS 10117]|uniref:Deacetylase sirtuin-type domain-containing protein n=1 Tax=Kwoniella dejecticola CBS 10117 TaxID=1296121 RepID=A0A1A6A4S9_9TREE|nr:uncharacterized protein I303_04392 [Kwoniella dejecticola CBS 10117]OBR85062.1 hypothetical protein I303_04392 [Kwoniella dejecticola CBS 10117]